MAESRYVHEYPGAPEGGGEIISVAEGSPFDDAGFTPGCRILSVDGNSLRDVLDWRWYADGEEITKELRTPEVTAIVSQVARLAPVREKMVELQRQMAGRGAVVMDGRDIATNVLPNADVKIFLTASIEERARRRWTEMKQKGYDVDLAKLQADIAARDKADSEREISPLVKAEDAVLLDTTGMGIQEVTAAILDMCR